MNIIPEKEIPSPDRRFVAALKHSGGPSWELSHATLTLAGLPFGSRKFRWHGVWSSCSRFFAISEWRSADYDCGPDMHLLVIDVARGHECMFARAREGFVDPIYIHDGAVKYSMITAAMVDRCIDRHRLDALTAWRPVSGVLPDMPDSSD